MVTKSRVANAFDVPAGAELALSSFEMVRSQQMQRHADCVPLSVSRSVVSRLLCYCCMQEVDSVLDAHQFRSSISQPCMYTGC